MLDPEEFRTLVPGRRRQPCYRSASVAAFCRWHTAPPGTGFDRRLSRPLHAGRGGTRVQPGAVGQGIIEEQLVFYTVEKDRRMWRYFDPRTYRSGTLDQEYLVSVMEQLI